MNFSPLNNSITPYGSNSISPYGNYGSYGNNGIAPYGNPDQAPADSVSAPGQECQTCKNRKYMDGSNEMVSYKTPTHISPSNSASAVRAHEQEHVSNAYSRAANGNGKVIAATVTLRNAVCPECGRSYVAGGTTNTQIKYYNEENPYQKDLKATDALKYKGMNLDYTL